MSEGREQLSDSFLILETTILVGELLSAVTKETKNLGDSKRWQFIFIQVVVQGICSVLAGGSLLYMSVVQELRLTGALPSSVPDFQGQYRLSRLS